MILAVQKYSFINAKVRGMKSRLLDSSKYRQLLETTQLDAFLKALFETDYAPELLELDSKEPKITEITDALDRSLLLTFDVILKFFRAKDESALIHRLITKIDVENLKIIIRGKKRGISPLQISDSLSPTNGFSEINYDELLNSRDVEHLVSLLGRTPYNKPLTNALPLFENEGRTAILERVLDETYYNELWSLIDNLSGNDKKIMTIYFGTFFDIINIMTILRYRLFYDIEPDEVEKMVIPMKYMLNKTEVSMLCGATEEDFLELVEDTYYGRRVGEIKDLTDLEIGLYRIMRATAVRLLSKGAPFHLGTIVGYLTLKEMEVTNLKSIAEGKRHLLSEEEISENLVM